MLINVTISAALKNQFFAFSIFTVLSNSSINWKMKKSLHGISAHTPDSRTPKKKIICGIIIKRATVIKT